MCACRTQAAHRGRLPQQVLLLPREHWCPGMRDIAQDPALPDTELPLSALQTLGVELGSLFSVLPGLYDTQHH